MAENRKIVSRDQWLEARKKLLSKEKEFTRLRDQLSQERSEMPWEPVEKNYVFEGPNGKESLAQLFDGSSQLVVHHFMFNPNWEAGCPHCSFWADNYDRIPIHLKHRNVSLVAVSRAPYSKIESYRERMGWSFKWLSSFGSDFNYDYFASFTPDEVKDGTGYYNYGTEKARGEDVVGFSVFAKDDAGAIFHTYSAYSRGVDILNSAYSYIDLTPKGRDVAGHDNPQFWVRRHDEYDR
ncbi:MAG TPA: thioredoxin family protein [Methylomirabilota bacterium]|nr:thioredoxin family protein [Methylomirabilota bacterium]